MLRLPLLYFSLFFMYIVLFSNSTNALMGIFSGSDDDDDIMGITTTKGLSASSTSSVSTVSAKATATATTATTATTAATASPTSTLVSPLGSSDDVFKQGAACKAIWIPAVTSSPWKSMTIDLMTGSNLQMTRLATVASGLDGTSPNITSYTFACPSVSPNSAIYFLQYTHDGGKDPMWTTRFTIADASGATTVPPNANQPEGGSPAIPWGQGQLVTSSTAVVNSPSATAAVPTSPNEAQLRSTYSSIFADGRNRSSSQIALQDAALPIFVGSWWTLFVPMGALMFLM